MILPALLLVAAATLEITTPVLSQFEGGPPIPGKAEYLAGETVFFTCLLDGFKKNEKESIDLEWKAAVVDEKGVPLVKSESGKIDAELAPEDKVWKPKIRLQFETPNSALCESCVLKLEVKDLLSGVTASRSVPFAIRGRAVEPSPTLVVRNFRFLRSEDDANPLAAPVYRAGDELWARFEITGFPYGPGNRVHVEYGLSVFRPSGKLLYQEANAATHDEATFYPRRYVNGILNLRLQGLPPGEYPILLEVRDGIGNQKFELRQPFRVE